MGCAAMRTRACEVFVSTSGQAVTEADYVGVYQLTEDIERGEERVNLAKLAPDENSNLRSPADTCWRGMSAKEIICRSGNLSR
jgi:hypothetical protein